MGLAAGGRRPSGVSRCRVPSPAREDLIEPLTNFWPTRGPQWDGLGRASTGEVLLVEAKSHVGELRSTCKAGPGSRARIQRAMEEAKTFFRASGNDWLTPYYQYANRLAHLAFLRRNGVAAHLLFICFLNDRDMNGPSTETAWREALSDVHRHLGLSAGTAEGLHELFINVGALA